MEKEIKEKIIGILKRAKIIHTAGVLSDSNWRICDKDDIADQILELVEEEKEKLLERIKLEKKINAYSPSQVVDKILLDLEKLKNYGYNQAIADLETLKEELKKELND